MTLFKRLLGVLVICLAGAISAGPAVAQSAKLEKAREVFRIMQADGIVEQMFDAVFTQMGTMMQQSGTELPQEAMDIIREEITTSLREAMPDLIDQMAVVYEEVFSEEELDGMLTFYKSPVGQSLLAKLPQVMGKSVRFSQTWAIGVFQDLPARVEQRLREAGYDL